ncbi:hypothetical protein BDZ89DRAFT_895115, partial [Hymenopellis radicata]
SQANGIIENRHYDVREGLLKLSKGNEKTWYRFAHAMIWAERVTVLKTLGMSPYRAVTGQEPLLPLDFVQATWMTTPPTRLLSHDELIVQHA